LVEDSHWADFEAKQNKIEAEKLRLERTFLKPSEEHNALLRELGSAEIKDGLSLAQLLRRPEISYESVTQNGFGPQEKLEPSLTQRVEVEVKFAGYLKRQEEEIRRLSRMESQRIPEDFDYLSIDALSVEVRQRLDSVRPETLGQASRISGVTPAALSLLAIHLKRV
jgi:tRNA uridine 5-carboxymethylaminomethyl modification enzyme